MPTAATNGRTSNVGEPSVAISGDRILATGNWYAARSLTGGTSWQYLDPDTYLLPQPPTRYCCDQTAIYVPSRDLIVYLLQYRQSAGGNTLRLAVSRGATLEDADWVWWDLTPAGVNASWSNEWFDYNHAALSDNYLYVGSNLFTLDSEVWTRSIVMRFPLDELATADELSFDYVESLENGSLRCTTGASSVMYVVGQNANLRQLRVYSWPETGAVTQRDIDVSPWRIGSYVSVGPDGTNWLGRCDDRITGAWVGGGAIGVLWSANKVGSKRPRPYIRAVLIEETAMSVAAEPDIWSSSRAYAYPDAHPNDDGTVGVTLFRGGGSRNPGHAVGIFEEPGRTWRLRVAVDGTHGPGDDTWGDYFACRKAAPNGSRWFATGFT
ncbi:MAG TPA: hypothetical protein VGC93_01355, partial [Thermoanaerobaculia bacterium]